MDSPATNPFEAPARPLGTAIPFEGTPEEAAGLRQEGLNRESTLRALGAVKLVNCAIAVIASGYTLLAERDKLQYWIENLGWPPAPVWRVGIFLVLGLLSLVVAYGLWQLQPWARWLQAASSGVMILLSLYGIALSAALNMEAAAGAILGSMLLGAVHAILLLIVLAHPAGRVCGEEYALVRAATPALGKGHVGPKVLILSIVYFAGWAGLAILAAVATS